MAENLNRLLYYMERQNASDKASLSNENVSLNTLVGTANNYEKLNVSAMSELIDSYDKVPTQKNYELISKKVSDMDFIFDGTSNFRDNVLQKLDTKNNYNNERKDALSLFNDQILDGETKTSMTDLRKRVDSSYDSQIITVSDRNNLTDSINAQSKSISDKGLETNYIAALTDLLPKNSAPMRVLGSKPGKAIFEADGLQIGVFNDILEKLGDSEQASADYSNSIKDGMKSQRDKDLQAKIDVSIDLIKESVKNYKGYDSKDLSNKSLGLGFQTWSDGGHYYSHSVTSGTVVAYKELHSTILKSAGHFATAILNDKMTNQWYNKPFREGSLDTNLSILKDPAHPKHGIVVNFLLDKVIEKGEEDKNVDKFIPDCIHYERANHSKTQPFVDLVNYNSFLKSEE